MKPRAATLQDCDAILIDIGGTIRRGSSPIDGAAEFIHTLQKNRTSFAFLSNVTTRSSADLTTELAAQDITVTEEQLLTANKSAIVYLQREGITRMFLVGSASQQQELARHGIHTTTENPEAVFVSLDKQLSYTTLTQATRLLLSGARYIATSTDHYVLLDDGLAPDVGPTTAFLHAATNRWPDVITGKPGSLMMEYAQSVTGVPASRMALIGDQLDVDINMAHEFGMVSVLVLSGQTQREHLAQSTYQPDYVVDSISHLTPLFR